MGAPKLFNRCFAIRLIGGTLGSTALFVLPVSPVASPAAIAFGGARSAIASIPPPAIAQSPTTPVPSRQDFFVESDPGIRIFVRRVASEATSTKVPLLLIHGARVPGLASFDLDVANGSLARDLAQAGHTVYILDVRGYGRSTRPPQMMQPRDAHPPLVRSPVVARDLDAVVTAMQFREQVGQVALVGWATGGQWAGYYATLYPEKVSHLVLYNALYGGVDEHPNIGRGSRLEAPEQSGQFNIAEYGAYRFSTASSLFPAWDRSIPIADKSQWRDLEVARAYAAAAIASDPTSSERQPPSFRAPSGALEDSFYLATGRQLWDASLLRSPTLFLRGERDFWSRPEDGEQLARHAIHAPVKLVTLANATHYVHLDRPERGRDRLIAELLAFLNSAAPGNGL